MFSDKCRFQLFWNKEKNYQNPKNRAELIEATKDGWDSIFMDTISSAIDKVQKIIGLY